MLLAFSLDQLLRSSTVDPPLQGAQFFQRGLMRRSAVPVRSGRLFQHAAQLGGLLERRQQEPLALGEIIGKSVVVIHNDHRSSDSCRLGKTIAARIFNDATIPALTTAPAPQIEAAQQS